MAIDTVMAIDIGSPTKASKRDSDSKTINADSTTLGSNKDKKMTLNIPYQLSLFRSYCCCGWFALHCPIYDIQGIVVTE